jgi:hypothetical protein
MATLKKYVLQNFTLKTETIDSSGILVTFYDSARDYDRNSTSDFLWWENNRTKLDLKLIQKLKVD